MWRGKKECCLSFVTFFTGLWGGVVEILEGEKGAWGGEKGSVVCHL